MNVLLINPNRSYMTGSKGPAFGLPLGLMYVASSLEKNGFNDDPRQYARLDGVELRFTHDDFQRELITGYCNVYGASNRGLGNIFGMGKNIRSFYRRIETVPPVEKPAVTSSTLSELA